MHSTRIHDVGVQGVETLFMDSHGVGSGPLRYHLTQRINQMLLESQLPQQMVNLLF